MVAWSKGAILNAIPFWKPQRPEREAISLQNVNVPIEQDLKMMFPPGFKERLSKQQNTRASDFVDSITSMPGIQNTDYLDQAEEIMFQAQQLRNRAQQRRLKKGMPIFKPGKTILNSYPVNVPVPTPVYGAAGPVGVGSKNPGQGIFKSSSVLDALPPGAILKDGGKSFVFNGKTYKLGPIPNYKGKVPPKVGPIPNYTPGKGPQPFMQFLSAISSKESGGNYGAVNSSSGAMGKYQIMPANISGPGGWDREALGREITPAQFMNSPRLQEAIARYKLSQYFKKYGAAGAASAWYSGSPTSYKSSSDIGNYVRSILQALGG
jgi:hypothetical protein